MKNTITSVTAEIGGKPITFETGLLAGQAQGAVTVRLGDTILLSAVTSGESPREGADYFPLQIEYREKYYAAGRFPGGYIKRETRPSEKEILGARVTDRPLRPLFPETYRNEVQINNMVLSCDGEYDSDVLSIIAASAALVISELPFHGPVGAVRIGRIDGKFVINPTHEQRERSDLDMIYVSAGDLPHMIEGSAVGISERDIIEAMKFAHKEAAKIIDVQLELRRKMGLGDKVVKEDPLDTTLLDAAREIAGKELSSAMLTAGRLDRGNKVNVIKKNLQEKLTERFPEMTGLNFMDVFDALKMEIVRKNAVEKGLRIDGRGFDEIRPLAGRVGILPRVHGSALFNRGETQALASVTLGARSDCQRMDGIGGGPTEKTFMLHYNFPPYSVGEAGRLGATSRREIGHGALAERSLRSILPDDYLYTVRLVSDITSSNGSSSMASVCAGSLALMDAGVPVKEAVAGMAIGLFSGNGTARLVVDIIGEEDHCGDMDFKVAGTKTGITGFQVDLKRRGLPWDLVESAFEKARKARLEVLDFMATVIPEPRASISQYAPQIRQIRIDPEKIGELIGPGGKNIRRITDLTGAEIDIDEDGTVNIFAKSGEAMDTAVREVELVSAEVTEGTVYDGTVVNITDFGAFVEVLPGKDGLVHISELADFRVKKVEDVCKLGDKMWVKCIGIDDRGRVRLSRRAAMKEKDAS